MLKNILNTKGIKELKKSELKNIQGGYWGDKECIKRCGRTGGTWTGQYCNCY